MIQSVRCAIARDISGLTFSPVQRRWKKNGLNIVGSNVRPYSDKPCFASGSARKRSECRDHECVDGAVVVEARIEGAVVHQRRLSAAWVLATESQQAIPTAETMRPMELQMKDRIFKSLDVIDWNSPDMRGGEVVARLRLNPALSGTRFISLSGSSLLDIDGAATDAGFEKNITKPATLEQLFTYANPPER